MTEYIFIDVVIPGEPRSLRRARAGRRGAHVVMYDPAGNVSDKGEVRAILSQAMAGQSPVPPGVPIAVHVIAVHQLPASKHRKRNPRPSEPKTSKPDLDNVLKLILDAATGVVWHDDCQVASALVEKLVGAQGEAPKTYVEICTMDGALT